MKIKPHFHKDMLQLKGLVTTRVDKTRYPDEIFIYARSLGSDRTYPHRGPYKTVVHGHGRDEGRFKDATFAGKKATIVAERARF